MGPGRKENTINTCLIELSQHVYRIVILLTGIIAGGERRGLQGEGAAVGQRGARLTAGKRGSYSAALRVYSGSAARSGLDTQLRTAHSLANDYFTREPAGPSRDRVLSFKGSGFGAGIRRDAAHHVVSRRPRATAGRPGAPSACQAVADVRGASASGTAAAAAVGAGALSSFSAAGRAIVAPGKQAAAKRLAF